MPTFKAAADLILTEVEALGAATKAASSRLLRARLAVQAATALRNEAAAALVDAETEAAAAQTAFETLYAQVQAAITEE